MKATKPLTEEKRMEIQALEELKQTIGFATAAYDEMEEDSDDDDDIEEDDDNDDDEGVDMDE